ncbi:Beta-galactosidase [subsurface metagenome]
MNSDWLTVADDSNQHAFEGFEQPDYDDAHWNSITVPHNWDKYEGYRRLIHGNRHGYAWYRKYFTLESFDKGKCYFLWFEGVGSYATVWVNGRKVGTHAGGRTSFTIDVTNIIRSDRPNLLAVRADHPSGIRDLPWVCGGCSDEWGFSEGSQPMGIFRPVHLIVTDKIRIEPFGVHIWNDTTVSNQVAQISIRTEIKNYSKQSKSIFIVSSLYNRKRKKVAETITETEIHPGETAIISEESMEIKDPILWSIEDPYLYTLHSKILEKGRLIDEKKTKCGIRSISWPVYRNDTSNQFLLNGEPVFINGIGEYEHMFGNSHAFSDKQIHTRVMQVRAAGFNAFRDAHQPHSLRYKELLDSLGILWWPQMSAHIWFDNPEFRENFKQLLHDWVKERRNSPSVIMWGLQNESTLPTDFAQECVEIIRELDPTTSSQRLVTTCNGGTGTDWNVIQNWSGTYGGDPENYAEEISYQLLNGEYGAWRSIDLHSEGPFVQQGILSENRMTQLMEMKVRQAESVKDKCCGQFTWLLCSHDNPGRIQSGEGLRDMDRIGPVNYKGLFTSWGEPLDIFYMYRANYTPKESEPMVYIVSHTWPNRWWQTGIKNNIVVYSNCDEVELFNDLNSVSLGKRKNMGTGVPFVWEKAEIKYNLLYARGYIKGKPVAEDCIVLNHLPVAPHFSELTTNSRSLTKEKSNYKYLYRLNCGGNNYTDENGNLWIADRHQISGNNWGSKSWTGNFEGLPAFYGSQRRTFDPIGSTRDWKLFQTFRFGREQLSFNFPVPDGEYLVELYFIEPWYGTGGGMDCKEWRLFNVAVNDEVIIKDFDIWSEAGHDEALKKEFIAHARGGNLSVHFPGTASGQAIISAIAIASLDNTLEPAPPSTLNIKDFTVCDTGGKEKWSVESWLDIGNKQYSNSEARFKDIPSVLYGADWIKTPVHTNRSDEYLASFVIRENADVFIAISRSINEIPVWLTDFTRSSLTLETDNEANSVFDLYNKRLARNDTVLLGSINSKEKIAPMYSVFIVPASSLEAPVDQRQTVIYEAEDAVFKGCVFRKEVKNDRGYLEIISTAKSSIEWKFSVGLASKYAIGFKYRNSTTKAIPVEVRILTTDNIIMHEIVLSFEPTGEKWKTLTTNTGTTINAGTYALQLTTREYGGLCIDALSIQ